MKKRKDTRPRIKRLSDPGVQTVLVFVAAFALYANTLGHGFVLDDGLVLTDNPYVQAGIRGIPDIVSHDSFHGTLGDSAYLSGGRYRPLSLVMFAVEVSFFGKAPFAHHLLNVLLYGLTAVVLLRLLRGVLLPDLPLAALATTLLFIAHPLHTEVVANIKSRDEILSLLFILLTLGLLLGDTAKPRSSTLWKVACCYALALLSKENGIILVGLGPLAILTFKGVPWMQALKACWPLGAVALLYLGVRFLIIGSRLQEVPGVLDNPYVSASTGQKLATIMHVLSDYLRLLVWPHPLTYDYSFAQVPYRTFGDPSVWLGVLLLLALVASSVRSMIRLDPVGWCAAFFLGTWLLVSGMFFNIGAPMAERFMYQASLPFILATVYLVDRLMRQAIPMVTRRTDIGVVLCAILLMPMAWRTIYRNVDWRDSNDLLIHDVAVSRHSGRANTYAGIACVRKCQNTQVRSEQRELATRALAYFATADSIVPDYLPILLNRGAAYALLDSISEAEAVWDRARTYEPENKLLKSYDAWLANYYYRKGLQAGVDKNVTRAIAALEKAVRYAPANADAWYNLGGAYFTAGDPLNARTSWEHTLQIQPSHEGARQGLGALDR